MAAVELIVFQVIVLFWSLITAESQVMMTRPGCPSSCGNISIPYPFGMKEGCYLDESFKILCHSSSQAPKLTVNGNDLEVRYISARRSMIRVMFPIVFTNCGDRDRNTVVGLEGSPFVFSSENYFIATGCGYFASMTQNQSIIGGCVSICDEKRYMGCSGINCCQTRIPSFLKGFNVTLLRLGGVKGKRGEKQCSYAYLTAQSQIINGMYYNDYYYEWNFDSNDMREGDYVPVDLDWGIDKRVFESFVNDGSFYNSSYTSWCRDVNNSSINSTSQSSTVQCSCKAGFEGNPYLSGICQEGRTYVHYRRKIKAKMAGLGVGVGFGALFLLIGLWWLYRVFKRKRSEKLKKKYFKRNGGLLLQEQLSSGEVNLEKIKMFPSKELDKATDHYNVNRTLGQGGQGTVYKGMLADGKIVAVKKSKVIDEGNLRQFINEG